ncbi:hypothetical protein, partial [Methylobacterium sp. GXF4]|uniref:hypothetical protein n=1 Tax=Methylobacterium sp. GXF4 TaxID=1096546 RepID=UPI001AEC7228
MRLGLIRPGERSEANQGSAKVRGSRAARGRFAALARTAQDDLRRLQALGHHLGEDARHLARDLAGHEADAAVAAG